MNDEDMERDERMNTGASTLTDVSCDDHQCKCRLNRRLMVVLGGAITTLASLFVWYITKA